MTNLLSEPSGLKNVAVAPVAIVSIIGILYYTKNKSKAQQQRLFDLIDKSHLLHLQNVYDFMNSIIEACNQSNITLTSIRSDLLIASKNKSFREVNVMKIHASCQEILTTFELLFEDNKKRRKQARKCLRDILSLKVGLEDRRRKNSLAYMAISLLGGGVFGLASFDTENANTTKRALLSGLNMASDALVGAGFTDLADFCTSYDYEALLVILNKLVDDTLYLVNCLSKSIDHLDGIVSFLREYYVSSARENIQCISQSGERVVIRASKMIAETNQVQNKFNRMKPMAEIKGYYINRTLGCWILCITRRTNLK